MRNKNFCRMLIFSTIFFSYFLVSPLPAHMTDVVMGKPIKGVELGKIDETSGAFVFFSKKYKGFLDIVRKNMPAGAEFGEIGKWGSKENHLSWIPVYLADLEGTGKKEIFLMAPDKNSGQKMLMIFDEGGNLLDQLAFESIWPTYMDFGVLKNGGPICFGLHWGALAAQVCTSEFYIFCDGKIKPAFGGSDISEDGNFTPPDFKAIDYDGICSGEKVTFVRKYQWQNLLGNPKDSVK